MNIQNPNDIATNIINAFVPSKKLNLQCYTKKCNKCFIQEKSGLGKVYPTGLSHFGSKDISHDLEETEVHFNFKIAYLVASMSRQQRSIFADIFNDIYKREQLKNIHQYHDNQKAL